MEVCVGGTFDIIHEGHKALLRKALESRNKVFIGLTSDIMVRNKKLCFPYEVRRRNLERFLTREKLMNHEILRIDSPFGLTLSRDFDAVVVSPETARTAAAINSARRRLGKRELKVIEIDYVLADDLIPFSSTRIRKGEIDPNGKRLKPVSINVGSTNPVKINAVRNIFERLFSRTRLKRNLKPDLKTNPKLKITCHRVSSQEQPYEDATVSGAVRRAMQVAEGADFGIGIEAGLFWNRHLQKYLDVQYCAVVDSTGFMTVGHGPGFSYPRDVVRFLDKGDSVGKAMKKTYGVMNIGRKSGAVGLLSDGLMDRTQLTEQAVIMALIPRISHKVSRRPRLRTLGQSNLSS